MKALGHKESGEGVSMVATWAKKGKKGTKLEEWGLYVKFILFQNVS